MLNCFKKHYLVLLGILFIAAFLRFYKLSSNPPGLYVDEAATGYNALSILKTGKDEYGKSFPVFFRSFGDYKMPLNVYLTVLPVWLFGLSVFSVRFLSAFFGTITTFLIYGLAKKIFKKNEKLAPLSALVYAISPWSIFISRVCFEGNIALFLLLSALLLQLKALEKKNSKIMAFSILVYALSVYSYHTERFIAPVMMLSVLLINYGRTIRKNIGNILWPFLFLVLLLSSQIILFFSAAGQARIEALAVEGNSVRNFFSLYTSYFSPRNLFFDPDPDLQRSFPELSIFYSWMIIPFIFGLCLFILGKSDIKKRIFLVFLLVSPIPAALTRDPFSTYRSYPMIFPYAVIIGLGIEKIISFLSSRKAKIAICFLLFIFSMGCLYRSVFILFPNERFSSWSFGYSQAAKFIQSNSYPRVLFNDPIGVTYIELLFFLKYPPSAFQSEQDKINLADYYDIKEWKRSIKWGKFSVRPISWREDVYLPQLIIAKPIDLSDNQAGEHFLSKAFAIIGPDGKVVFNGYLTNPELKIQDNERKLNEESRNF